MNKNLDPSLQKALSQFLNSLKLDRGAAKNTLDAYSRDLDAFFNQLGVQRKIHDIQAQDIHGFLSAPAQTQLKATSLARKISVLRQFFKFCCIYEGLQSNPAEDLELPKAGHRLPKALTLDEVNSLLMVLHPGISYQHTCSMHLQARDRAMVLLMYATGLRVSELTHLTLHNLELASEYLRVRGKGQKERIVPFAMPAGQALHQYLTDHRPLLSPSCDEVFLNHRGAKLTRQAFWKILKELAILCGLPSTLSPHQLRHSFATHLLQSGMNLRSLQMLLGHADLSTTQIYTQVSPEHLKDAHRRYHPRGSD